MTAELETAVTGVFELAMHLSCSAEVAASDAATVRQDAALELHNSTLLVTALV